MNSIIFMTYINCIDFFVDIGNDYIARIKFILLTSGSTVSALIIKNSVKVEINEQ